MWGRREVLVKYKDQVATLPLIIVKGMGHSLLGRNWLQSLVLDWAEINTLQHDQLQVVLDRHSAVFGSDLGALKGLEAKIAMPHPGSARLGPLHMPTGSW